MINFVVLAFQMIAIIVIPATNATSEHSFSALRRLLAQHYMIQSRLNHLMLLYYHQDLTDELNKLQMNLYLQRNSVILYLLSIDYKLLLFFKFPT